MSGERILLVDPDTSSSRALAELVLLPRGFTPLMANGEDEGVKKAIAEAPHLVLLHLPLDESAHCLRRLRQAGHPVPAVLMLDQASVHISVELLRLGVRDYLVNPSPPDEVVRVVSRVLSQEAASSHSQSAPNHSAIPSRRFARPSIEATLMARIGQSVGSSLDLEWVLKRISEAAAYVAEAEEGHVLLVDDDTGQLRLRAARHLDEKRAEGPGIRTSDNAVGMVASSTKSMLTSQDGSGNPAINTGYLVKSQLHVPLKANGHVIGVLGVEKQTSEACFTQTHLRRLSALADSVGPAVENARQHSELLRKFALRVREIADLQVMAHQLGSITGFGTGAQLALSLALKATNADAGVLAWVDEEGKAKTRYVSLGSLGESVLNQQNEAESEAWWDERTLQSVLDTGEPLLQSELEPRANGHHPSARSRLIVPMRRGKRVVGAIHLESLSPGAFTRGSSQFVLTVADQSAIALEETLLRDQIEAERERITLLLEASDSSVWIVDADLRLVAQNQAASDIVGWPRAAAIGRPVYELVSSDQASLYDFCQLLTQSMEEQRPILFPEDGSTNGHGVLLETREGRSLMVRGRAVPLFRGGHVVGALCAFRESPSDTFDQRTILEFANMASHLLRSPLSFIQASIDLMTSSELDSGEQRLILDKMREQSQRMREFIKDLLEMSRLETGSVHLYPEPVLLPPLIERVLNLIRTEDPRFEFTFSAPGSFPIVAADPGKTELVLLSLLRSTMGRCPDGGLISLELEASSSEAIIRIGDEGECIPPKQLERIFSQFYPVDDADGKMPSTYELGLYSAKRLIELQNGRVWAESQPGRGTRFGLALPVWR